LFLIEKGFWKCCNWNATDDGNKTVANELDNDVVEEYQRINRGNTGDIIEIKNLRKSYNSPESSCCNSQSQVAVSNLSFGLKSGECFALLGVNGAGKSTTFKSLTCEV